MPDVVVLRDSAYAERQGEEEMVVDAFLRAIPDGVNVEVIPPELLQEEPPNPDVFVSFGLTRYPDEVIQHLIKNGNKHVCVLRGWWDGLTANHKARNEIVTSARRTVFSSPLHHERFLKLYGVMLKSNIIPVPVDPEQLASGHGDEKKTEMLWVAPWTPEHGNDLLLAWATRFGTKVHAYGPGVKTEKISAEVECKGPMALQSGKETFEQYASFVYLPRIPVPFGYASMQAYALDLDVQMSNRVGWVSYNLPFQELVDKCVRAPQDLWEVVLS